MPRRLSIDEFAIIDHQTGGQVPGRSLAAKLGLDIDKCRATVSEDKTTLVVANTDTNLTVFIATKPAWIDLTAS